jgi:Ca2+/Na+ antiporter
VSGNGFVYAAIVGIWAVVLLPTLLHRHDPIDDPRSMDRFSTAMRILARRTPSSIGSGSASSTTRASLAAAAGVRSRLAARRRRMLIALTLSTMLLAVVAALGNLPWWSPLVGVALVTLFVVHLRMQARRSRLVDRRRRSLTRSAQSQQRRRDREDWVRRARERRAAAVEEPTPDVLPDALQIDPDAWAPVPVPLPTYVTAPKAVRHTRVIDLTTPGAWTSGRLREDEPATIDPAARAITDGVAPEDATDEALDGEIDDIIERRPATG